MLNRRQQRGIDPLTDTGGIAMDRIMTVLLATVLVATGPTFGSSPARADGPSSLSLSVSPAFAGSNGIVDRAGECAQWVTDAPSNTRISWSIDGVVVDVGVLSGYSLCPDWSWYSITTTAKVLELTLWPDDATVAVGNDLATAKSAGTPIATASATYSPTAAGGGDGQPRRPDPIAPHPIALSCSPDAVVAGGAVTCEITGGDPDVDILWRASYDPTFASQGVRLDAEGRGSFSFVAPVAALGLSVTVELVEWDRVAVFTVGVPVPASVPAGEGPGGLPLGTTLGGLLVLAGALRLRLRRSGAVA